MRIFSRALVMLGRLALLAATAAFLTSVSLLLLGSYLMTWPILRKSPRDRRIAATVTLASSAISALMTFTQDQG